MLKTIIVEDEPHGRETLKNLLTEYCEDVTIAALCGTVVEGIEAIDKEQPDLVFLDIELHTGNGFEVLEQVKKLNFEVVFTTAYEDYAIKAIKFSALDYLLKPIDISELKEAVEKTRERRKEMDYNKNLHNLVSNIKGFEQKRISLSTMEGVEFIKTEDIIRLEANGSYTNFFLVGGRKLVVSKNLKEYENLLSDHDFYRTHYSTLINLRQVDRYLKQDGGCVVLKDGSQAPVSQKRKELFFEAMKMAT
ncbi:LytR/AlgR family response regulator transcription factor [Fulvivirga ligni]|uniref:LytR/AlgR family response regulator transcription factor n=1 Tax=Fulvivirga ligni TaxID=2904246 RepID=UPI001F2E17B5|nr:LytTR family DNA-binding domain-containing protein [Fulvivirga ligni]UII23993.1 LytTR family DNA-binding domain-containing protein [Fulvivirga ligni]